MRLLVDLCIARLTILGLRAEGHDVLSLAEEKSNPSDREILALAAKEERVVLTEDADFGELIFRDALAGAGVGCVELSSPRGVTAFVSLSDLSNAPPHND